MIKIMTTFKTFAITVMMTIFSATATYANNNGHNHNSHKNHPSAPKFDKHINYDLVKEYEQAKHCNCKACKELVKKVEMHIKQMNKNNKNQCNCQYCNHHSNVNKPIVGHPGNYQSYKSNSSVKMPNNVYVNVNNNHSNAPVTAGRR